MKEIHFQKEKKIKSNNGLQNTTYKRRLSNISQLNIGSERGCSGRVPP